MRLDLKDLNDSIEDSSFNFPKPKQTTRKLNILDPSNWISESDNASSPLIMNKGQSHMQNSSPCSIVMYNIEALKDRSDEMPSKFTSNDHNDASVGMSMAESTPKKKTRKATKVSKSSKKRSKSKEESTLGGFSKKQLREVNKAVRKKEELLSEMILHVSQQVYETEVDKNYLLEKFTESNVEPFASSLPIIYWRRKLGARYDAEKDIFLPCETSYRMERTFIIFLKGNDFIESLVTKNLELLIVECKNFMNQQFSELNYHPILVVRGYQQSLSKIRSLEEKKYKRAVLQSMNQNLPLHCSSKSKNQASDGDSLTDREIENLVNEHQMHLNFNFFPMRTTQESIDWMHSFTHTIANSLYDKYERNMDLSSIGSVKSGSDPKTTFLQSIKMFKLMTTPKTERLYNFYKNLVDIHSRYQKSNSLGTDFLHKNIVPPSVDEAMHRFFTSADPNEVIHE